MPWERGLTLDESVIGLIANEAGLDGMALAKAGLKNPQAAWTVLRMLRAAAQTASLGQRKHLAERTQTALARLEPETRAALTGPVMDRITDITAEPNATQNQPSVNPDTGLQEFTTVSTQDQRPFSQHLKDWWQNQIPKPITTPPINPDPKYDPRQGYGNSLVQNPSLLPKPAVQTRTGGNGLLPKEGQNEIAEGLDAGGLPQGHPVTPRPLPQRKPRPHQIFNPTGGEERKDSSGEGWFGAPRGNRIHHGVDITLDDLEKPILAPISGTASHCGQVYSEKAIKKNPALARHRSVHVKGNGPYEGMKSVLLYVDESGAPIGTSVEAGKGVLGNIKDAI